jgi:FkbM family methyltransferase
VDHIPNFSVTTDERGATLKLHDDRSFLFPADARAACDWLRHRCQTSLHEPKMSNLVIRFMTRFPRATFLDAGALFGYFSALAFAASNGRCKAFAFEMNPASFAEIVKVAAANQHAATAEGLGIFPVHAALGNRDAEQQPAAFKGFVLGSNDPGAKHVELDFLTINSFAREHGIKVGIMKIDVEGYEGFVLEGAAETLLRDKTVVLLELHGSHILAPHGMTRVGLLRSLIEKGFRIYFMGHQRHGSKAALEVTTAVLDENEAKYEGMGDSLVILTSDDIRTHWRGLTLAE